MEIEKLHTADDGHVLQWHLDLHLAFWLTIECAHLVNLDGEHRPCVSALIDHFLQKLWLTKINQPKHDYTKDWFTIVTKDHDYHFLDLSLVEKWLAISLHFNI